MPGRLAKADADFVSRVRYVEEKLFSHRFDETDPRRIKHEGYAWHYRPSHHAATGLIGASDIDDLSRSGKRILSVGAFPCLLEQVLSTLGISDDIVVADINPSIHELAGVLRTSCFDATTSWPDIGTFDLIIFPESLCIAISGAMVSEHSTMTLSSEGSFPTDPQESRLLAHILGQALRRLRPNGEILANGPMSHPKVVKAASALLLEAGHLHSIEYRRFFMRVH